MMRILVASLLLAAATATASAQQAVFVVRHAERADGGSMAAGKSTDPDLSDAGKLRAEALGVALKDAAIKAIYTTEFKRTQQTAAPLAKALGIQPVVVPSRDLPGLLEKLKAVAVNALVVGHSNTVAEIIAALGVSDPVKLEDADYDNLFIVLRGDKPSLIRLHFR